MYGRGVGCFPFRALQYWLFTPELWQTQWQPRGKCVSYRGCGALRCSPEAPRSTPSQQRGWPGHSGSWGLSLCRLPSSCSSWRVQKHPKSHPKPKSRRRRICGVRKSSRRTWQGSKNCFLVCCHRGTAVRHSMAAILSAHLGTTTSVDSSRQVCGPECTRVPYTFHGFQELARTAGQQRFARLMGTCRGGGGGGGATAGLKHHRKPW